MVDATIPGDTNSCPPATIRPEEAAHFGKLAADWWDPKGTSAMLHKLNPVRLAFLRGAIDAHWPQGRDSVRPLAGKSALDVGCGAGLLCEPLARLGADVTGVDAAAENVAAAAVHADGSGLPVRYMAGEVGALDIGAFDLVTAMEVIEHVADKPAFIAALAARIAPGGLLVLSTPNRTPASGPPPRGRAGPPPQEPPRPPNASVSSRRIEPTGSITCNRSNSDETKVTKPPVKTRPSA